jgi:hypothetical protein
MSARIAGTQALSFEVNTREKDSELLRGYSSRVDTRGSQPFPNFRKGASRVRQRTLESLSKKRVTVSTSIFTASLSALTRRC